MKQNTNSVMMLICRLLKNGAVNCYRKKTVLRCFSIFSKREHGEFTFAICHRPSVCRLSVTFVHRTQANEIFRNVSTPFGTLAIC